MKRCGNGSWLQRDFMILNGSFDLRRNIDAGRPRSGMRIYVWPVTFERMQQDALMSVSFFLTRLFRSLDCFSRPCYSRTRSEATTAPCGRAPSEGGSIQCPTL